MTSVDKTIFYQKLYPYINDNYFKRIVQKSYNHQVLNIENFQLYSALKKGENYSSEMIRVKILYNIIKNTDENADLTNEHDDDDDKNDNRDEVADDSTTPKELSLILKATIINEQITDVIDLIDLNLKEILIYRDVLPMVYKTLQNAKDFTKFSARLYDAQSKPNSYLLFEDLSVRNYKTVDRKIGLDYQHLKLVLKQLAKWHSATAVIGTKDPMTSGWHESFLAALLREDTPGYFPLFQNGIRMCADAASKWIGYERISKKLYKLKENIIEKVFQTFTRNENDFNVLIHGDLWANNIMFKYDDGNLTDAIMVDFSTSYWGSPAIDLSYLLFSSCTEEVNKESQWNELIEYYSVELTKSLKLLNYQKVIPTVVDIMNDITKKSMYSVVLSIIVNGIRQLEDIENADISLLLGTDEKSINFQCELVSSKRFEIQMKYLLNYYDRMGWLD